MRFLLEEEDVPVALSLHIVFLSLWAATLLYLPILFARHALEQNSGARRRLMLSERWLYAAIMTPSAVLTVLFGIWLIFERGFDGGWLPVKLMLVLAMALFHVYCGHVMVTMRRRTGLLARPAYYRALTVPSGLLVLAVVTLVTAKPF